MTLRWVRPGCSSWSMIRGRTSIRRLFARSSPGRRANVAPQVGGKREERRSRCRLLVYLTPVLKVAVLKANDLGRHSGAPKPLLRSLPAHRPSNRWQRSRVSRGCRGIAAAGFPEGMHSSASRGDAAVSSIVRGSSKGNRTPAKVYGSLLYGSVHCPPRITTFRFTQ